MSSLKDRLHEAFREAPERVHRKVLKTHLWKAAGVSSGAVTQWFDGTVKSMAWEHAQAIAPELGVSAQWLYDGTGNKIPAASKPAAEKIAQGSPYDAIRGTVSGFLEVFGLRFEDLVGDVDAARARVEAALLRTSADGGIARTLLRIGDGATLGLPRSRATQNHHVGRYPAEVSPEYKEGEFTQIQERRI